MPAVVRAPVEGVIVCGYEEVIAPATLRASENASLLLDSGLEGGGANTVRACRTIRVARPLHPHPPLSHLRVSASS
jgi:hypothetical protein